MAKGEQQGGRPYINRQYKTERTKLTSDDREVKGPQGTKLYTPPPNSTPSLMNMRRTLESRPQLYDVRDVKPEDAAELDKAHEE